MRLDLPHNLWRGLGQACLCMLIAVLLSACFGSDIPEFNADGSTSSGTTSASITGTVTDAVTGEPIAGVTITTIPETKSAVTNSAGQFTLSGIADGTYSIVAAKDNYCVNTASEILFSAENTSVDLVMYRQDGVVTGTVKNTRGAVLDGVAVFITDESNNMLVANTTTDATGTFTIEELPLATYTVSFVPATTTYTSNEKVHLTVNATHTLGIVLSGKAPESASYVGSQACTTCHETESDTYIMTSHANVIKEPLQMSPTALTQFQAGQTLSLDLDPGVNETLVSGVLGVDSQGVAQMTIGNLGPYTITKVYGGTTWKENYIIDNNGQQFVLPFAWSVTAQTFIIDPEESPYWFGADGSVTFPASQASYEQRCVGCHVTGLTASVQDGVVTTTYSEDKIGCESCHGPGSKHADIAAAASNADSLEILSPRYLSVKGSAQVCGQCHERGHAKLFTQAALAYPVDENGSGYRAGEDLDTYFTSDNSVWDETSYSKSSHQELEDFYQSKHYTSTVYNPRCSDCHNAHGTLEAYPKLLKQSVDDNTLCLSCHTALNFPDEYSIRLHTQHPYDPTGTGASRCVSCHMTKTGTVSAFTDVGGHTFVPVKPAATLAMLVDLEGAGETEILAEDLIPNPCMQCHNTVLANAATNESSANALGGDPTSKNYLEMLSAAFDYKFIEAKANGTYASFTHKVITGWTDKESEDHHGKYYLANPETCTNACHGKDLQGGSLSDGSVVPSCFDCHNPYPHTKRIELDNPDATAFEEWRYVHRKYFDEETCKKCHGDDYTGGISGVSCYKCHLTPGVDFTQFQPNCADQTCHGTPPALGAHDVHYNGVFIENAANPQYGDTTNYSTPEAYRFGCGTCHPMSQDKHRNGAVDIELYNEHADPDTMKGKMPSNAAYDPETHTCNNVYCHSYTEYVGQDEGKLTVPFPLQPDEVNNLGGIEGQIKAINDDLGGVISSYFIWNNFKAPDDDKQAYYWSLPLLYTLDLLCSDGSTETLCAGGADNNLINVLDYDDERFGYKLSYPDYTAKQVRRYQTTPSFLGDETLPCNGCHDFPPRSYMSADQWSETDPDWASGKPSILREAAIDKHSFVIPKLSRTGTVQEVGHMANMRPFSNAPLRCQTCHYQTVSKVNLRDWESGQGWTRENGLVKIDNLTIADRSVHANGKIDVVFDESGAVTSYRFNNTNYNYALKEHPKYDSENKTLINAVNWQNLFYGIKGENSPGATWDPETKTCSNVSCHLEQTKVTWTNPYRPYSKAECYQCHQYYSDPTKKQDETMCWPHAETNGCETSAYQFEIEPGKIHESF